MWEKDEVKVGDMVLVVEETAPGTWRLGRVQQVHPGRDNHVRVVTIKTSSGVYDRPIQKLVPLVSSD